MTHQMVTPTETLLHYVNTLCNNYYTISPEEAAQETEIIRQQGHTIVDLVGHMINSADNETGKEDAHD
jgi:hypothetical protein